MADSDLISFSTDGENRISLWGVPAHFGAGQVILPSDGFRSVALAIPAGMLLGVALMVLFLEGFFPHALFNKDSDLEAEWED